jgi:hypothetical protein
MVELVGMRWVALIIGDFEEAGRRCGRWEG